jgi:hypothetical protein
MDTSTKSFIYKTYCRTLLLYGQDLVDMNEKNYKILRQDESILLKRIIGLQKQASTTKTYQSLNIQELIYTIRIMKMKLWIRLEKNDYTRYLIESLEEEYKRESLEENKNKNEDDGVTQNKNKKKKYQDKSLLLEIKELYQLFNIVIIKFKI